MKKELFKRILTAFIAIVMIVGVLPAVALPTFAEAAETTVSGECGDDLTWSLDTDTGVLTISGTGDMWDFGWEDAPWGDYRYNKVKEIVIENGVTSIGSSAFVGCVVTSITFEEGSTLERIGNSAFAYCHMLKSISLPASVTDLDDSNPFRGCSSLESITVDEGNTTYKSVDNCIIDIENKKLVSGCKNSIIPDDGSVEIIGENAFENHSGLTSIVIPDSVKDIERAAFWCTSLTSIAIPDSVESIGKEAFLGCRSLTSITIPASVTSMGKSPFSGCSSLESITVDAGNTVYKSVGNCLIDTGSKTLIAGCKNSVIPADGSVTSIGDNAFEECNLTSITIPNGVESIGNNAFAWCTSLESITIPASVTSIGYSSFAGCSSLESITVDEGNTVYKSVGNCLIDTGSKTLIAGCKNSVIPADGSVTSIGDNVFYYCTSLTSITIPNSVTSIEYQAFAWCEDLTKLVYCGTEDEWNAVSKGYGWNDGVPATVQFHDFETGFCIWCGEKDPDANIEFGTCGESLTWVLDLDTGVLKIWGDGSIDSFAAGSDAPWYDYKDSIKTVVIGKRITSIGSLAFFSCSQLEKVIIESGSSLEKICAKAFYYSSNLTTVIYCGDEEAWDAVVKEENWDYRTSATAQLHDLDAYGECVECGYGYNPNWSWMEDGKFEVPSYDTAIVEDGTIKIDGKMEAAYTSSVKITSYDDKNHYRRPGYEAVWNDVKGDFFAYVVVDTNGMYVYAEIEDSTIFDELDTNAQSGDGFQIYFDWTPAEMMHPSAEKMYDQYLLDGTVWETTDNYRGMWGLAGMQYIGNISYDYRGNILGTWGFGPVQALGLDGNGAVEAVTELTADGWKLETFIPWREDAQKEAVAKGEQFHCGIGFQSSDDADIDNLISPDKELNAGISFDRRKEVGLSYWNRYSSLADLSWGEYPDGYFDNKTVEGECGESLTWALDPNTGVLTISGTGDMWDFSSPDYAPWYTYRNYITKVVIEEGVERIGTRAFVNCSSLTSITFEEGIQLTIIGDSAFYWCPSLTSITIPNSVTSIGVNAFLGCDSLTSVIFEEGSQLTIIGDGAFYSCDSLTSITIPNSVTSIGDDAFGWCTSLTKLVYCGTEEEWNAVTKGDDWNYNVPATVQFHDLDADGVCVKCGYKALITGECGDDLTWIFDRNTSVLTISGTGAMWDVSNPDNTPWYDYRENIAEVIIENGVTSIGEDAFNKCFGLASITIPDGVTSIGDGAFGACTSLTSITIPNSVTIISDDAFFYCTSLTSITIPNSVTNIGEYAFDSCTSLTKLVYCGTEDEWKAVSRGINWNSGVPATVQFHDFDADGVCVECGYGAKSATITVESATVFTGDTVELTVDLKDNPGISGLVLTLKYDETALRLVGITNGSVMSTMTSGKNVVFNNTPDSTADGTLVTLTFEVLDKTGDFTVDFIVRECSNEEFEAVDVKVNAGELTIIDFIFGDVNGDRVININDVIMLNKYLAAYDYDTGLSDVVIMKGADANGDGKININDVILLNKYLAAYDYDTGSSTVVLGPDKEEEEKVVSTYKIVTYNDGDNTTTKIANVANFLLEIAPDIIGMQEVQMAHATGIYPTLMSGYASVYYDHGEPNVAYGAPILYKTDKFELVESGTMWLSDTPEVEGSKFDESAYIRSFVYAVLKDKETGLEIVVVNTHIDYMIAANKKQVEKLLELTEQFEDKIIIYTADWNMKVGSDGFDLMNKAGYTDGGTAYGATVPSANNYIDFIFVDTDEVTVTDYEFYTSHKYSAGYPEAASDHNPVMIEITITQ